MSYLWHAIARQAILLKEKVKCDLDVDCRSVQIPNVPGGTMILSSSSVVFKNRATQLKTRRNIYFSIMLHNTVTIIFAVLEQYCTGPWLEDFATVTMQSRAWVGVRVRVTSEASTVIKLYELFYT